jgi:hypothetical protein
MVKSSTIEPFSRRLSVMDDDWIVSVSVFRLYRDEMRNEKMAWILL